MKFKKLVVIEPVALVPEGKEQLKNFADQVILYDTIPANNEEILERIGDADAVLISFTSRLEKEVIDKAPNIRYIGMCCSLYSEESANVDIAFARTKGIQVTGIRDYGDKGVVEYVLYQLVQLLHGYGCPCWKNKPMEITGLKVGIIGLGTSGGLIAEALQFLGADISYFARTPKPEREAQGMHYKPLHNLLRDSQVIFTCLNKNVILLHKEEFDILGNGKIMFNTSIGPASDLDALEQWLSHSENIFCCDTLAGIGPDDYAGRLVAQDNVHCVNGSSGLTVQAYELLTKKVLENIQTFLNNAE